MRLSYLGESGEGLNRTRPGWRAAAALLLAASLVTGCESGDRADAAKAAARVRQQRLSRSDAMIDFVATQLEALPELVPLRLSPPTVVLDAKSSRDGRDVMALALPAPGVSRPMAPLQTIAAPAGNANFRGVGVRPGDTIKCFLLPDAASRDRLMETGEQIDANLLTYEPVEVEVTKVLSPVAVFAAGGLRVPTSVAKDLVSRLGPEREKMLVDNGLPEDFLKRVIDGLGRAGQIDAGGVPLPGELLALLPGVAWPSFRIEVWREADDRMIEINNALADYIAGRGPPLAWRPTPDAAAIATVVQRLGQWVRGRQPPEEWPDGQWLATLPDPVRTNPALAPHTETAALVGRQFTAHDGRLIQEALWARDIGRWAIAGEYEPVAKAARLFDWAVRNVALSTDPRVDANRPWLSMLYGRGTVAQRAWVFSLLCRQQKLPSAIIEAQTAEGPWLWCVVLDGGDAYLFDPQLGLPLPGAGDAPAATLSAIRGDPSLLAQLDLPDDPFPVTADALGGLRAFVVGDPFSLSWRAAELQGQFTGASSLSLASDASEAAPLLRAVDPSLEPALWPAPLELLARRLTLGRRNREALAAEFVPLAWRPRLWKARALHFRGRLETAAEARARDGALAEPMNDHRSAGRLYLSRRVRPADRDLDSEPPSKRRAYRRAKADASYWLGVLQFEEGAFGSSIQWLERAERDARVARTRRRDAIAYHRARSLEAAGRVGAAAELLRRSRSPQRRGDLLRAEWLTAADAAALDQQPASNATTAADAADR